MSTAVGVETGAKKTFVWAYDWPGWCRSARTEEAALEALVEYADRYRPVADRAGLRLPKTHAFDVAERLGGDASTEFGIPAATSADDARPVDRRQATRLTKLMVAAWETLDEIAADSPQSLRKGPRGGGRDRDKMLAHVLEAEAAYARRYGIKHKPPALGDKDAVAALRDELLTALRQPSDGTPPVPKGWTQRYTIRRVAWHALDHAWEMQDRRQ
jgi:hypothetical protein